MEESEGAHWALEWKRAREAEGVGRCGDERLAGAH